MKKQELTTPAILVDADIMQRNLEKYQNLCNKYHKQLWPMTKTHKSIEMVNMQKELGATGFLAGTLDECEAICGAGIENIMYAYPVATKISIDRVISLAKKCNFIIRIDCRENADILNKAAVAAGITINYTIIVDSGLHRFGIAPEKVLDFAETIKDHKGLCFKGISTHPGHVYGATCSDDIPPVVADEKRAMKTAADALRGKGYKCEIISSGSTPTFFGAVDDENINIYHPGNYVFNDVIQMSTETASEDECALTVYASVISHPREDLYIIDAGAKCFGLDQGAHGNTAITGFGRVKGHPELVLYSLSEEVGKLHFTGETSLRVGDKIEVIPNHACVPANLTSFLTICKGDEVVKAIQVDIRGNSKNLASD